MKRLPEFNLNSNQHISLLFFGGQIQVEVTVNNGLYKNGKIKTKKEKVKVPVQGLELIPKAGTETATKGFYSVNEENLLKIEHPIAQALLEMRNIEKQISTYYTSVQELVYDVDNCIHQQYQHPLTNTGRLSCKAPNAQNVPAGESLVKEHFVSRYVRGQIVSADYSQIEIRVQGQMSQDTAFIADINNGIDFHLRRLALKEGKTYEEVSQAYNQGCPVTKRARTAIKGFSFARAYGAGPKKISEQTGLSINEIKTLIENEAKAYPRLELWQQHNKALVERQGFYTDPWGQTYKFSKYPAWKPGMPASYSPTEIMNYMTQGFATGVIVLAMIGEFWRQKAIHNRHKYLMINTVHDSLMLDAREHYVRDAVEDLKILEEVSFISKRDFNYEFNVPIKVDVETGDSWHTLKKYEDKDVSHSK